MKKPTDKEAISFIAVDGDYERELIIENEQVGNDADSVITAYWAPLYDGEPMKDRILFAVDLERFREVMHRIDHIWPDNDKF